MQMGGGGRTGYTKGVGGRGKVLDYVTVLLAGVSCLQLSLITTDQNIVFPVPCIIPVVFKDCSKRIMTL